MTQISRIFTPGILVTYVLLTLVIDVPEYIAANGQSPYARWFNGLNAQAAAKLAIAVTEWPRVISPTQRALEPRFTNNG